MQTIHAIERTAGDGTLTLRLSLDRPDTEFEVVVVVQPKTPAKGPTPLLSINPWAGADAIRQRLAATGRDFGNSVEEVREDRNR